MVSGPDLGAGFLYQLTRVRDGPRATFTFHAQEGGQDASGPPIGTPEPFGWARPVSMCPFGGRVCWHRRFEAPDLDVGGVRAAYNRTRFVMEAQLAQAYRAAPVPWEAGLQEWMARAAPALSQAGSPWWLEGAAARAVEGRGEPVPRITIRTDERGVRAAGGAIGEYLIEPVSTTTWGESPVVAARAFLGTLKEGTRVEWAAPAIGSGSQPPSTLRSVPWKGLSIPILPME